MKPPTRSVARSAWEHQGLRKSVSRHMRRLGVSMAYEMKKLAGS